MAYTIQCESGEFPVPDIKDIKQFVDQLVTGCGDAAYWLHKDDKCVAGFFFNGEHASTFRYSDGAEPFNPEAPEDETTYFRLENGELDEFELSKCVDYDSALDAFAEIATCGTLSQSIQWSP